MCVQIYKFLSVLQTSLFFRKELILKQKEIYGATSNAAVSKIEHRTKEVAIATNKEVEEARTVLPLKEW